MLIFLFGAFQQPFTANFQFLISFTKTKKLRQRNVIWQPGFHSQFLKALSRFLEIVETKHIWFSLFENQDHPWPTVLSQLPPPSMQSYHCLPLFVPPLVMLPPPLAAGHWFHPVSDHGHHRHHCHHYCHHYQR